MPFCRALCLSGKVAPEKSLGFDKICGAVKEEKQGRGNKQFYGLSGGRRAGEQLSDVHDCGCFAPCALIEVEVKTHRNDYQHGK